MREGVRVCVHVCVCTHSCRPSSCGIEGHGPSLPDLLTSLRPVMDMEDYTKTINCGVVCRNTNYPAKNAAL